MQDSELYPIGPLLLAFGGVVWLIVLPMERTAIIVTNLVLTAMGSEVYCYII